MKLMSFNRSLILFGISLALLLFLLEWLEVRFLIINHSLEIYIGAIALIFTLLGSWVAVKLAGNKTQTIVVEKEVLVQRPINFSPDQAEIEKSGMSARELEVLHLIAEGLSNQEMADKLFVSVNTVKTHISNILSKLDVKRRTQALEKARRLGIIG